MFCFVLIAAIVLIIASVIATTVITSMLSEKKNQKEIERLYGEYCDKAARKEEVIKDAREKKESVDSADIQSGFDSSLNILQDLSQRR